MLLLWVNYSSFPVGLGLDVYHAESSGVVTYWQGTICNMSQMPAFHVLESPGVIYFIFKAYKSYKTALISDSSLNNVWEVFESPEIEF